MTLPYKPPRYHDVTPYLIVRGAQAALDFYARALGATELMRVPMGDLLGHAEILVGDSIVMLADEMEGYASPQSLGGTAVSLMVYVPDVDAAFARALAAGATATRPVADQFYGDRTGVFTDPWGHQWTLATHVEEVSPEEIARRLAAMAPGD